MLDVTSGANLKKERKSVWDVPGRVKQFKELWAREDLNTESIARLMGITKNQVCSKARGLGLPHRTRHRNQNNSIWGDAALVEKLKELWARNDLSATVIGMMLGGLTKNQVLGKAFRLGLPPKGNLWVRREVGKARRERRLRPKLINGLLEPQELPKPPEFLGITLEKLEPWQCRSPQGEGPFLFCGQPIERGSYCAYCYHITHRPPRTDLEAFFGRAA